VPTVETETATAGILLWDDPPGEPLPFAVSQVGARRVVRPVARAYNPAAKTFSQRRPQPVAE